MKASSGSRMIAEEENKRVKTINPATEDILNEYDITSKEQISNVIRKAENAFERWKKDINRRIDFYRSQIRSRKTCLGNGILC